MPFGGESGRKRQKGQKRQKRAEGEGIKKTPLWSSLGPFRPFYSSLGPFARANRKIITNYSLLITNSLKRAFVLVVVSIVLRARGWAV